jgi:hypothetical protein
VVVVTVHSDPIQRERLAQRAAAGGAAVAGPQPAHPLQQALNDSPRMAPQWRLQRMLGESPRVAEQAGLAARLAQRHAATGGTTQRVAEPSAHKDAAVRRDHGAASQRLPLRAVLMQTTSLTPVQRAGWGDWVPGVSAIASVLGSGYVGAKAGTALGSYAGPQGAFVGGILGGLAGLAGGAYGALRGGVTGAGTVLGLGGGALTGMTYGGSVGGIVGGAVGGLVGGALKGASYGGSVGGLVGGVVGGLVGGRAGLLGGAAIQDAVPAKPEKRLSTETIPSLGTVTYRRAVEREKSKGGKEFDALNNAPESFDDPELKKYFDSKEVQDWVKQQSPQRQKDFPLLMVELIDRYYGEATKTTAKPRDVEGDMVYAKTLSGVLEQDLFIKTILAGGLEGMKPPVEGGALKVPENAPSEVAQAGVLFNNLVSRKVTPLPSVTRSLFPESGIHRESGLKLGSASPAGAALHELGHHLEYNLAPSEFATLHNFLRARSASEQRRYVGYEAVLGGRQSETGYDIGFPDLGIAPLSLTGLIGSGLGYRKKKGRQAAANIDRFIVGYGNRPESSYASQISETSYDTEFLSTTIHFFGDPGLASKLVRADPLRVCLFLSFANPEVYERVRKAFAHDAPDAPNLNRLIHKVTLDNI